MGDFIERSKTPKEVVGLGSLHSILTEGSKLWRHDKTTCKGDWVKDSKWGDSDWKTYGGN